MGHVLVTCRLQPTAATLESAARQLGVEPDALDADFGVVLLDPTEDKYAVMVEETHVDSVVGREGVEGPFANPPIEPFGPPEG